MAKRIGTWLLGCLCVVLVAALLFPIFAQAKHGGRSICLSNVKRLAVSTILYAGDYDEVPPLRDKWMDLVESYQHLKFRDEHCDKVVGNKLYGYALNAGITSLKSAAADKPLIYDSINLARNASDLGSSLPAPGRHAGSNTIAYADGHARKVPSQ